MWIRIELRLGSNVSSVTPSSLRPRSGYGSSARGNCSPPCTRGSSCSLRCSLCRAATCWRWQSPRRGDIALRAAIHAELVVVLVGDGARIRVEAAGRARDRVGAPVARLRRRWRRGGGRGRRRRDGAGARPRRGRVVVGTAVVSVLGARCWSAWCSSWWARRSSVVVGVGVGRRGACWLVAGRRARWSCRYRFRRRWASSRRTRYPRPRQEGANLQDERNEASRDSELYGADPDHGSSDPPVIGKSGH